MIWRLALAPCLALSVSAIAQTDEEVAARLSPAVHVCEKSPENGGTLQQAICYRDEAIRQDQRLNETWKRVVSRISHVRGDPLRRSERRWIIKRETECKEEAQDYINSTARYMFNVCMANEAIRRTMWLERLQ